jgi:hypothetical protein
MTGFDLLTNYLDDPEVLLKKAKASLKKVLTLESEDKRIRRSLTPEFEAKANKTLREFSTLTTANIRIEPQTDVQENGFELKPALINMVQASQFCEKTHEDASAHLQHFLEIYSTFTIKGVTRNAILLCLFPFSLLEKAK